MRLAYLTLPLALSTTLLGPTLNQKYPIGFFEGMAHSRLFKNSFAQSKNWQVFKRLYQTGMNNPYETAGQPRIPALFHLIWLGSKVPDRYVMLKKKLEKMHPGCAVKIWTDREAASFFMTNRRAFDSATNYGEKSDIFRYEILYQHGGVYLDGDFEILKPFTDILYACNFFAGMAYAAQIELYNGLIGASPQHPIIKRCIETLASGGPKEDVDAIIRRTGPLHFTRCFLEVAPACTGITIPFPVAFFYPWPNYQRAQKSPDAIKKYIKPYSIALHKWACSWIKKL